jgi:hypothetical protein
MVKLPSEVFEQLEWLFIYLFFVVLEFELRVYTLSHPTAFFVKGFFFLR